MEITDIKGYIKRTGVYRSKENGGAVSIAIAVVFILYLVVRSLV